LPSSPFQWISDAGGAEARVRISPIGLLDGDMPPRPLVNFARFDAKLEQRLAGLRLEFRTELHQVRTELLRWMFGFWVTTLLGIAGLLIALRDH
jgi:hypothetical protein